MAASAFSARTLDNPGGIRFSVVSVTPSTSYPTGGEPVTPANAGFSEILAAVPVVSSGGVLWTYVAGKLKAFRTAAITVAGGAAAAGTDALSIKASVLNKESASAATVLAQGALAEVTNAVDLSADTFTILVVGR